MGFLLGLASKERLIKLTEKEEQTKKLISFLSKKSINLKETNKLLEKKKSAILKQKVKYKSIISRPHITISDFIKNKDLSEFIKSEKIKNDAIEQAEIKIKYGGYLNKEKESAKKLKKLEGIKIPENFQFKKLHSISTEGREKLHSIQPKTIGQASRISGVSPSDINILLIYLGR